MSDPVVTLCDMTFVNAGTLGTIPGHRDDLVAMLTQRNDLLRELGCSLYKVGTNPDTPDTVFVVELWDTEEAHRRSLEHPDVQAAIAAARPILSGEFSGFRFSVVGSPLRDA
jgi:quinol monooxygenase YgiN